MTPSSKSGKSGSLIDIQHPFLICWNVDYNRITTSLVMFYLRILNIFLLSLLALALVYLVKQLVYKLLNRIFSTSSRRKSLYDLRDQ